MCVPHHNGPLSHFSLMSLHRCMYTTSWWSTFTLHSHVTACVTACVYHITINGPLSHFSLMSLHRCMYTTSWWSTFTLHSHVTACVYHITINGPLSHFSLMLLHMCTTSQLNFKGPFSQSTVPQSEAMCCLLQQTPKRLQLQICKHSVLPLYVEDGAVYKYSFSFF